MNETTPIFEKVFSREEFASRVHDVKLRMERAGYDLIISQDPSNMCWLTGYDGWSFYVPQCVLVHLQEDSPFWFGRAQDSKAARVTTYLPDENIIPYSEIWYSIRLIILTMNWQNSFKRKAGPGTELALKWMRTITRRDAIPHW